MDKNTLSNYGWIVIAVLVLSVMIALATPFGSYIEQGVRATTEGLFDTSKNAVNSAFEDLGVQMDDQTFEEGYSGVKEVQLDILQIENKTYSFEVGMTWEEWVNSEYNTDNYFVASYQIRKKVEGDTKGIIYGTPFKFELDEISCSYDYVGPYDEIVKDELYSTQPISLGEWDSFLMTGDKYFKRTDNDGKIIYNQIRHTY